LTCLVLLGALVVMCTLSQVQMGTFPAIEKYFRSFLLWAPFPGTSVQVPWFPAGGAVGLMLLVNLAAMFFWRLQRSWRKSGLWLVHAGLTLFIVGEYSAGMLSMEAQMPIEVGASSDYAVSPRRDELVVVDESAPDLDTVYAVPQEDLKDGRVISHPGWPFSVKVDAAFANAEVGPRPKGAPPSRATQGIGPMIIMRPAEKVTADDERNLPAAYVDVLEGGKSRGTWLVSSALGAPQEFFSGGRKWALMMRAERHYLPFTLTLEAFHHDVYAGTDIPKNFSSQVRLTNPATGEDRDVLIYMNNPLRYHGYTFYQASFGKGDRMSVLQVVRNPGWLLPYFSFLLLALGLLIHFGRMLWESKPAQAAAPPGASRQAGLARGAAPA
ncbi:MAG: cytochrome c biogenesis protein ResB, partial [Elusimicrobia bacterium]|nr:cytochrome c biogenesis protein ResB [Elusimicrobiota bacterium]